jgi:hypothetical protein
MSDQEQVNPLASVQPATTGSTGTVASQDQPKESFAKKTKIFFEHIFSFFDNHAKAFETSAATTIALVSPLLNTLVTLTAGAKEAAVVSSVVGKVTTALNNTAALLSGAEAGDATHSVTGFLTSVQEDLPTLLADADVKNSTHVAQITGVVNTVLGEVQAILAAVPADHSVPVVGAAK